MHFLTQNVRNYPKWLETTGILWIACCIYVFSADNNLITICVGTNPCPLLYPVKIYFGKQLIFHGFVI